MSSSKPVATFGVLLWFASTVASAQSSGTSLSVHDYPMLDARKIYSTGQEIRVGEPHRAITGLPLMDDFVFLESESCHGA